MRGVGLDFSARRAWARSLRDRREEIARSVTDEFLDRHPDWVERYGERARRHGEADAGFHLEFLAGALLADEPGAFEDYVRWTARILDSRGMAPVFLVENLRQVAAVAGEALDPAGRRAVTALVDRGIRALEEHGPAVRDEVDGSEAFAVERSLYLQAVRNGERHAALSVAEEALRDGASVADVYREILQPAQYAIGHDWEWNRLTVIREQIATAITHSVMTRLYHYIQPRTRQRGRAVITGVLQEQHYLGAHMVADVLEADGWNVRFLGPGRTQDDIGTALDAHRPHLVGISATLVAHLPPLADLAEHIRARCGPKVAVLVGGRAFRHRPDAWRELGVDGYAADLREAVALAAELVPEVG